MKTSKRKRIALYIVLLALLGVGISDIALGNEVLGAGIIGGAAGAGIASLRNIKRLEEMENQGINPYDERVIYVAGKAARTTYALFALGLALFVGLGAAFEPEVRVNPYDFAGILLAIYVLLYFALYRYFNHVN